jgi:hypothetical protein
MKLAGIITNCTTLHHIGAISPHGLNSHIAKSLAQKKRKRVLKHILPRNRTYIDNKVKGA